MTRARAAELSRRRVLVTGGASGIGLATSRLLRARRGDVEGTAPPDRNDEYLFYQLLLGAWPAELTGTEIPEPEALRGFAERMEGVMLKSMREAKRYTTWAAPNSA